MDYRLQKAEESKSIGWTKRSIKQLKKSNMALNYVKGTISHKGDVQQELHRMVLIGQDRWLSLMSASFNGSFTKIALTAQNQRVNELAEYNIGDRVEDRLFSDCKGSIRQVVQQC